MNTVLTFNHISRMAYHFVGGSCEIVKITHDNGVLTFTPYCQGLTGFHPVKGAEKFAYVLERAEIDFEGNEYGQNEIWPFGPNAVFVPTELKIVFVDKFDKKIDKAAVEGLQKCTPMRRRADGPEFDAIEIWQISADGFPTVEYKRTYYKK